jgi:hypothetical protein
LLVKTLFILKNGNNFVPLVFIAKISICLFFKVKRQKINLLLPKNRLKIIAFLLSPFLDPTADKKVAFERKIYHAQLYKKDNVHTATYKGGIWPHILPHDQNLKM